MIDLDRWTEIGESLARNRVRTLLTMGSVAWGTFVLVVLLGAGRGLENSIRWEFRDDAMNSVWVYRGKTSRPFAGNPVGRSILLTNRDYDAVRAKIDGIEHITGRFYVRGENTVSYGERSASYNVRSVHPDHQHLEQTIILRGRYLDELDVAEKRKVVVIGRKVADYLFRGADPLGTYVNVVGVPFRVVGVFDDVGGEGEVEQVYVPISTAQATFGGYDQINQIMFTLPEATPESAGATTREVRALLADRLQFDPRDNQAIRIRNNVEEFARFQQILGVMQGFVWMIGLGTVTAGLVGVSNITLVSVRERTVEIALRKALGATPFAIVRDVVQEAIAITAVSGYSGIVAGVLVLVAVRTWMPANDYLRDPEIHLGPALVAAGLLTVAGAVAGFFPAWLAARVPPVEGLREG